MRLPESSWRPDNLTSRPATFLMYNPPRGSHIRKPLPSEDAPTQAAQAPALWTLCARLTRARGIGPGEYLLSFEALPQLLLYGTLEGIGVPLAHVFELLLQGLAP